MLGKRTRTRKGFTLVELLVVIVIIAVLVAIALPRYYQAIYDSKCSACKSNLKQIDLALHAYYANKDEGNRDWNTVWTNCGAGATMTGTPFAAAKEFAGGFPVCPFGTPYTAEQVTNANGELIGVQTQKASHFVNASGEWYDAPTHVPPP